MRTLIIFAKAPQLGTVKTRLAQESSPTEALRCYEYCLKKAFEVAQAFSQLNQQNYIRLYYSGELALFNDHLKNMPRLNFMQQASVADLGRRMLNALSTELETAPQCVMIGSDAPQINLTHLEEAFSLLKQHDAVFGPAADGGYYLIGLKRIIPQLFECPYWSTSQVLDWSLNKLDELGKSYALLSQTLTDVDTLADWHKVSELLGSNQAVD